MNTTFEPLFSYLAESIDNNLLALMCLFVFVAIALFYIKIKSKSGFTISNKLYAFLIGHRKDKSKGRKKELINDIIEIEKFNFHYNTNAVSKRQIYKFEGWVKKFELDFKMIAKLKNDFDIEKLKINKVANKKIAFLISFIFIPAFIAMHASVISLKPSLLIHVKPAGWFWINKDKASGFSFYDANESQWVLTPQICAEKTASKIIDKNVSETICGFLSDKETESYVDENIKYQQSFFMFITFAFCMLILIFYKRVLSLRFTFTARKMLLNKLMRYRGDRTKYKR